MSRAPWVGHFGFTRTPFSKNIPASRLCDRASHQEAVARIRFCVSESLVGVITGEVGVGKTVAVRARAHKADLIAQTQTLLAAEEHERPPPRRLHY
jgi:type II secretory pathway predicted ATPase ExeA